MKTIDNKKPDANLNMGSLYDMNKKIHFDTRKTEKPLSKTALKETMTAVLTPYLKNKALTNSYFMLLNNERRDYTVFRFVNVINEKGIDKMINECIECFETRGLVISVEAVEMGGIEIWFQSTKNPKSVNDYYCYYFFPYDNAVIEIKE